MNVAELQAALTAFGGLVGAGREAFLWWVAYKIIENFSVLAAVGAIIYAVVYTVKWLNPREHKIDRLAIAMYAVRSLWLNHRGDGDVGTKYFKIYEELERDFKKQEKR